jgi:hypothetical protein
LISDLFTPTLQGDSLRFHHAYATYTTEVDQLVIETSTDGGSSFSTLATLNGGTSVGTGMVTASAQNSVFVPSADQWGSKSFLLPAGTNKIRFKAISAYGNNLYLDRIYILSSAPYTKNLNLKVFIEGMLNPSTNLMTPDTIKVFLREAGLPYSIIDSAKGLMNSTGDVNLNFTQALNSTNYYYQLVHRNAIETWSSSANSFTNLVANYDFSNSSAKAYGNNMVLKAGKWCLFSGDVNHDGFINTEDLLSIFINNINGITGYVDTDLNNDMFTEIEDMNIIFKNNIGGIERKRPSGVLEKNLKSYMNK